MPWQEVTKVSLRLKFVINALEAAVNIRAICREYGISPTTRYMWLSRYLGAVEAGLRDRPRRPNKESSVKAM